MRHRFGSFPCSALFAAVIAGALAVSITASADPVRVEAEPLENGSALASGDVTVLDSVVLSALSELPQARFEVVAGQANADPGCDKSCRTTAAATRGVGRLVVGSIAAFGEGFVAVLEVYDVASNQLLGGATTGAVNAATDLLAAIKTAAAELRRKIDPPPAVATPTPAPAAPAPIATEAKAVTSTLRVETVPTGARVYLKRVGHAELIGEAPVEKELLPTEYRVIAQLPEHENARKYIRLDPFEKETVHLTLQRIYPMSPYKKWGHVAFWPGAAATVFGFIAIGVAHEKADDYRLTLSDSARENARSWTGGMWAGFGLGAALMTTGIVLWAATPSDKEHWEKSHGAVALSPMPDGGVVAAYGRRF